MALPSCSTAHVMIFPSCFSPTKPLAAIRFVLGDAFGELRADHRTLMLHVSSAYSFTN